MSAARTRAEVAALQALLTVLGVIMVAASRRVDRFRRQVTRDLVIEISSADGAGRQYRFDAATRRMTLLRRPAEHVECRLVFSSAWVGLRTLLSTRTIGRLVKEMNFAETRIDGNPAVMLWFHGLTRIVVPIGRARRPRRPAPVPIRDPERHAPYAKRIVREPSVDELSRDWPQAWAARAKLLQIRAPAGERLPPG